MDLKTKLTNDMFGMIERHLLSCPQDWERGRERLSCNTLGVEMYIGAGRRYFSLKVDGCRVKLPLLWKWQLWRATEAHAAILVVARADNVVHLKEKAA